mmetsp:Transcript_50566/g.110672  ORF Transcript_50566/g.110672 Transcript_50566/m.110672 type:complete len:209 (-) Transcript_50566:626-1252(-)
MPTSSASFFGRPAVAAFAACASATATSTALTAAVTGTLAPRYVTFFSTPRSSTSRYTPWASRIVFFSPPRTMARRVKSSHSTVLLPEKFSAFRAFTAEASFSGDSAITRSPKPRVGVSSRTPCCASIWDLNSANRATMSPGTSTVFAANFELSTLSTATFWAFANFLQSASVSRSCSSLPAARRASRSPSSTIGSIACNACEKAEKPC